MIKEASGSTPFEVQIQEIVTTPVPVSAGFEPPAPMELKYHARGIVFDLMDLFANYKAFPNGVINAHMEDMQRTVRRYPQIIRFDAHPTYGSQAGPYLRPTYSEHILALPFAFTEMLETDFAVVWGRFINVSGQLLEIERGKGASQEAGEMKEADFLLTLMKLGNFPLSPQQRALLDRYPDGVLTDMID